jgi:hypothetical protein
VKLPFPTWLGFLIVAAAALAGDKLWPMVWEFLNK